MKQNHFMAQCSGGLQLQKVLRLPCILKSKLLVSYEEDLRRIGKRHNNRMQGTLTPYEPIDVADQIRFHPLRKHSELGFDEFNPALFTFPDLGELKGDSRTPAALFLQNRRIGRPGRYTVSDSNSGRDR